MARLKRCRTGCLTCRVRRRKCDERRPQCRNCTDKDLECRYGSRLTFLDKNVLTVQSQITRPLSTSGYSDIRFVNEHPERIEDASQEGRSSPHTVTSSNQPVQSFDVPPSITSEASPEAGVERKERFNGSTVDDNRWIEDGGLDTSFNDGDESAVRGLLALGTASPERAGLFYSLGYFGEGQNESSSVIESGFRNPSSAEPCQRYADRNDGIQSQMQTLQLLRNYRYEVAPWLDIFDLQQSFGIKALQIATVSETVFSAILSLSRSSLTFLNPIESSKLVSPNFVVHNGDRDQSDLNATADALLVAIQNVQTFISNIPQAWGFPPQVNLACLNFLGRHALGASLESNIYWLFLRLDLSAALANDSCIKMPIPETLTAKPSEVASIEDMFDRTFRYTVHALFLCARALQWRDETNSPHMRTVDQWVQIASGLNEWYHNRSQEFQPVLELGIQDLVPGFQETFPVVLFTNGAGVLSNQLYHTAMLLLIQDKPRTARLADQQPSTMSPLWHARRICSIALNNDRREWWDVSLLASLLVAARCMTHESQHQSILHGFGRIQALTGWDISESLHHLHEEWNCV